jgi:dTDP-4-amino-4,6-dideoxygalactose transaminase
MLIRRSDRFEPGWWRDAARAAARGEWIQGPSVSEFEAAFAAFVGTRHAIAAYSGVHALGILLEGFPAESGDEVVLPAYTSKVVLAPILAAGLRPRFYDIDPRRAVVDPDRLERAFSSRTRAVILTHLFGRCCSAEAFERARRRGVFVIEDCAHAHGASRDGRRAGSRGDAAFFSFDYCKLVNTFMGGMIVTNDGGLAARARERVKSAPPQPAIRVLSRMVFGAALRAALSAPLNEAWRPLLAREELLRGLKARLDRVSHGATLDAYRYANVQSVVGLRQLANLPAYNAARRRAAL